MYARINSIRPQGAFIVWKAIVYVYTSVCTRRAVPFAWLVGVVIAIGLPNGSVAQTTSPAHEAITDVSASPFGLFDDAFYQNQLFLVGESHGVQKPQELDFALFKHLNERVGVRHYIAEVDFVKAQYLNDYLRTGQDSTLMRVFQSWIRDKAQWANRDFVRKLQRIRAWNQTLPANRTIQFVGVDAVQDKALTAAYLAEKLVGKKLPQPDRALVDSLLVKLRTTRTDSLAANAALNWLVAITAQEKVYQKTLGAEFAAIRHVVTNVSHLKTIRSRENTIVTNFKTLYDRLKLQNQKLYGFWGVWHVLQAPTVCQNPAKCVHPMATQLRASNLPLHDKIVSITCAYVDCKTMLPSMYLPPMWREAGKTFSGVDKFNDDGELVHRDGIGDLKAASKPNTMTLFKLAGSAYGAKPVKVTYASFMPKEQQLEFEPARPATDYGQYVVLIRNSDATEPLVP